MDKTITFPFTPPQGVGGHSAVDYIDPMDISEASGIFLRFENLDPLRFGRGNFAKRRAVITYRNSTNLGVNDPIVNMIYNRGVSVNVNGALANRDILWILYYDDDGVLESEFGVVPYTPSKIYTSTNWVTASNFNNGTTPTATNNCMYPTAGGDYTNSGRGIWKVSPNGHVHMAFGAFVDSYPCKAISVIREKEAPFRDGFFADPNTPANGGGIIDKSGYVVVPEKPWTSITDLDFEAGFVLPKLRRDLLR